MNNRQEACIIISASGMMEAGRVKHHIANNIDDPKNSILAIGYCAPTTLGARILGGEKQISIFGTPHTVNAEVFKIDAFSGHADYQEMEQYLRCQNPEKVKKLFIVHGDYEAQVPYSKVLAKAGFKDIVIPTPGEVFQL